MVRLLFSLLFLCEVIVHQKQFDALHSFKRMWNASFKTLFLKIPSSVYYNPFGDEPRDKKQPENYLLQSLSSPPHSDPVPNKPPRFCGRKVKWSVELHARAVGLLEIGE